MSRMAHGNKETETESMTTFVTFERFSLGGERGYLAFEQF
jgi:hypothetical protein